MRILLLFLLVAWYVTNVEIQAGELYSRPAKNYKESITIFAKESFKVVFQNKTGNFIYSPVGASILLTMAAFGAGGRTACEIRTGLALPPDDVETSDEITTILNNLNRHQAYRVRMANKIFTPVLHRPKQEFINMTKEIFKSRTRAVNISNLVSASHVVNKWFEAQTDGWVTKVSGLITEDTELLIFTAGYIDSNWRLPFESRWTRSRLFYANGHEVQIVRTMMVSGFFPYGELYGFDATFVELPFANTPAGDAMSMYVILPNKRNGLPDLLKCFDKIDMFALMSGTSRSINVYLPKFKFESSLSLEKPLRSLGFVDMFLPKANFSGIAEERPLRVSKVFQKIHIDVYEGEGLDEPISPILFPPGENLEEFRADHPFVCVIMKEDGIPLFITVVNDPRYRASEGYRDPFTGHRVWSLV